MSRLGRAESFKPQYFYRPPTPPVTVFAGVAVAVGTAPPRPFVFRADACAFAYQPTPTDLLSPPTIGAAGVASGVTTFAAAGVAAVMAVAYNVQQVNATGSVAAATGTASGVGTLITVHANVAQATGTANNTNTNNPIYWTAPSATMAWVSGEDIDWVYES